MQCSQSAFIFIDTYTIVVNLYLCGHLKYYTVKSLDESINVMEL
jgi:hypothetical protein